MKIKEIISEGPGGAIGHATGYTTSAAAKGLGAVAGGVVATPKRIVKGVKAGADAWDKLMTPSSWFGGKSDAPGNTQSDDTFQYKDTLKAVSQGLVPNAQDNANLKQLAADSKSPEEQAALKAAYSGQKLSPEQMEIIKQLSYKL